MDKTYYIAYGSNLNVTQMISRCPGASVAGYGFLQDWELRFRGSGTGAYLTIEPQKEAIVPVGIWEITDLDEKYLDRYEGFPHFYYKRTLPVVLNSYQNEPQQIIEAMVYIMREDRPLGRPTGLYVQTCAQGYIDFQFDMKPLSDAVYRARKEAV